MKTIAFVTYADMPAVAPDDMLAAACLKSCDIKVVPAVWNDPAVDWSAFDGVIIRSCWDYHLQAGLFQRWLHTLSYLGVPVYNTIPQLLWNMDKRYLRSMGQAGIPIPPTLWLEDSEAGTLQELVEESGWREVVVKPAISGSAYHTYALRQEEVAQYEETIRQLREQTAVLVQPLLPEILREGEWSLLFFNGAYSHAVLKRARADDFRVQAAWGGTVAAAQPPEAFIRQAAAIVEQLTPTPLYARVDGVSIKNQFTLMELELIEPALFLAQAEGAAQRFANHIAALVACSC